jgi:hypothetical protein
MSVTLCLSLCLRLFSSVFVCPSVCLCVCVYSCFSLQYCVYFTAHSFGPNSQTCKQDGGRACVYGDQEAARTAGEESHVAPTLAQGNVSSLRGLRTDRREEASQCTRCVILNGDEHRLRHTPSRHHHHIHTITHTHTLYHTTDACKRPAGSIPVTVGQSAEEIIRVAHALRAGSGAPAGSL